MASINLSGSISATGVSILGNASIIFASDANHTLSVPEYTNNFLEVTSSVPLTVTRNLIAPLVVGQSFVIQNNTTGGQAIQVIGASGTGVVIANGSTISVICDGTNYLVSTASSGGAAGGDLSGTYPNPTVRAIQGHAVSTVVPQDGYALVWDGYQNAYVPTSLAGNNAYLNQPTWFIDSINGFDGYTGTSATFISGTVGPIQTCAELLRRYGTRFPVITQSVTVTLLNDVPTSDPWLIQPTTVQGISYFGTNFTIIGTLIQTGTATIGTFTPQTHGATQNTITASGQSGAFWTPFVGNLVQDTTVSPSAWFWVTADAGTATAKISEPLKLNAVFIGGAPPYQTIANGNSLVMYRPTNLYVPVANGNLLNPGIAFQTLTISGGSCEPDQTIFDRCSINCLLPDNIGQSGFTTYSNCDFSPNILSLIVFGNIYGGSIRAPSAQFTSTESSFVLDGDVVCTGTVGFAGNSPTVIGRAGFFGTLTSFQQPFFVRVVEQNYGQPIVWGTASFNVLKDSTFTFNASFTAASQWLSSGALTIDGLSTANPWNATANIFHAPVSITPANVDVYGSLQNPLSGSKIYKEGAVGVTTYLTQTAWFVDPQNVTTTASDNNTGLTSGAALRTKAEIIRRWGTNSPILNGINVVITYLSADTNGNDPGIFKPFFLNGATLTHTSPLPTASFTGSLLAVTAKNHASNTPLRSTFTTVTGAIVANMLLVNVTRGNSRAFAHRDTGGGNWQISQPFAPYISPGNNTAANNAWANGDTITGYVLTPVNLVSIGGQTTEYQAGFIIPQHIATQLTIFDPNVFDQLQVDQGSSPQFAEIVCNRAVCWGAIGASPLQSSMHNSVFIGEVICTAGPVAGPQINGGLFRGVAILDNNGNIQDDVIFAANVFLSNQFNISLGACIDTGATCTMKGDNSIPSSGIFYGAGTLNVQSGTTRYVSAAVATFPLSGGLQLNGVTTGYSNSTISGITTVHGGIALTAANLDASAGPTGFGGYAYGGGAVFSQAGIQPTGTNFLTQTAWFVDPSLGFDGYDGSNSVFTSGTTGPLKTKAEIIRRWGTNSPILNGVNVTITYVSANTDGNDPGIFTPFFVNGATLTHIGALPSTSFTGTLLVVTPKNVAANQALRSTFTTTTGAVVANMLLVNTTRGNSRAIAQRDTGGGLWQISQPMAPYSGIAPPPGAEINTWANGDTINGYILLNVDLVVIGGVTAEAQVGFGPSHIVQQLTAWDPIPGHGDPLVIDPTAAILLTEMVCLRAFIVKYGGAPLRFEFFNSASTIETIIAATSSIDPGPFIAGGIISGFAIIDACIFQGDTIFAATNNGSILSNITFQQSNSFFLETTVRFRGLNILPSAAILYGTGTINVQGASRFIYQAGSAVTAFPLTGGLTINGASTASAYDASGDPALWHPNRALTAANLDATVTAGGFGGNAINPGGGSITNGGV